MQYLILAFVITPIVELYLLIKIGGLIGAFNTIMLVVLTGIAGALLARSQGLAVLNKINSDLESGSMPAEALIDGLFILVGGLLLITPGIITDIIGFIFVIPHTRAMVKKYIKNKLKTMARDRNSINIRYFSRF